MADTVLAVFILLPALITYFLKSNAALAYLTLCAAFVLITLGSADLSELTGQLDFHVDSSTLNFFLLIVPLLLTFLLTRRAFSGKFRTSLQVITALCAGGLLALVAVPLINFTDTAEIASSWGWVNLQKIQTLLIATGFLLSLFLIWSGRSHHSKKHKK